VDDQMADESLSAIGKTLSVLKEFRTPIQIGALSLTVIYLIYTGPYENQYKILFCAIILSSLIIALIPEWRKTEVEADIERRKINADLTRGIHWTEATFREMTERSRIESIQRKQGALDAFDILEDYFEGKLDNDKLEEQKREIYEEILEQIRLMKIGADSFALGFHEQVMREEKNKRGRFAFTQGKKEKTE